MRIECRQCRKKGKCRRIENLIHTSGIMALGGWKILFESEGQEVFFLCPECNDEIKRKRSSGFERTPRKLEMED